MLPHLDAAYNLARWLVGSAHDAEDAAQEACLRAITYFDSFHGEDGRTWLLAIVRHACYDWLRKNRGSLHLRADPEELDAAPDTAPNPETVQLRNADRNMVREALEALPADYREVLVLRELEGMSYREIAKVTDSPIGTVMSRLARGRKRLEITLAAARKGEKR
jgi:RNA polymerase sigma-70 factor (ECF subfamily)